MRRVVILGTGTGVGKTTLTVALLEALKRADPAAAAIVGVKPIETGVTPGERSDASLLENASVGVAPPHPHPLFAYPEGLSPHLAARRAQASPPTIASLVSWLCSYERAALHVLSHSAWMLIETAGAVFSPLAPGVTNFDLMRALEPAICVLVAPDSLGTLHDTTVTLEALARRGRSPDYLLLSAARLDASTGTNAHEMRLLGIANPSAVLDRDGSGLDAFAHELVRSHGSSTPPSA